MPKAERGSTKDIANRMKAKGLQRLRWYCQICSKQCRDENGFKQHTLSEGHVRAMITVGEDPKKYINDFSRQFQRDFLHLLKTSHGEKKVSLNGFYQEYIGDKEHVHMNSTKWPSLTEFAKYLGREGLCRVEENEEQGGRLEVAFIDDSPEAVRRREDVKRKEKMAKGDEDHEARMLEAQVRRAREAAERAAKVKGEEVTSEKAEVPADVGPVKVSLNLSGVAAPKKEQQPQEPAPDAPVAITTFSAQDTKASPAPAAPAPKISMSLGGKSKGPVNPLMKKNALSGKSAKVVAEPEKKMSNAERIMREEMERKRRAEERFGGGGGKRQRVE